jgi:5-methylcytosine-specific restriction endonuclease McrA
MEPFSHFPSCSKCGHDKAETQYHAPLTVALAAGGSSELAPEHIERTCERCGYTWKEATLDQVEREREEQRNGAPSGG